MFIEIDDTKVPVNTLTQEPVANIRFVKGQWVLVDAYGRNLPEQYRAIPSDVLQNAVLFQAQNGDKVGYIDNAALTGYLRKVTPPSTPVGVQIKNEINNTISSIQKAADAIANPDPEVAKLSEKFRGQYLAPGKIGPKGGSFLPLNKDGSLKRTTTMPGTVSTPDSTLAGGSITDQTRTGITDGKDRLSSRWAAVGQLSFDESGFPRDEFGQTVYVLATRTPTSSKAYTVTQRDLDNSVYKMSAEEIKRYQQAFKSVGQWDYEVNGELNYLTRGKFLQALNTAALETTAQNLQAYGTKDSAPQNLLTVVADAARQLGGVSATRTTAQTYITNRETAQQILDDTYLQSIGRKANKKEVDEFYQKVQKEAKARPTVTTRGTGSVSTKAGFTETSVVDMAGAQAEARPEFLAYQLSTNFYNALLGASRLPMEFGAGEAPTTGPLG
jgi:hypothetical protein